MKWDAQKQQFRMAAELMYGIEGAAEGGERCEEMTFGLPRRDINLPIKVRTLVCALQNAWRLVDIVNV